MWSKGYGVFGVTTHFSQLRGQVGYLYCCNDEFGVWGTLDLGKSCVNSDGIELQFRAISQVSLFWKLTYCNKAETMIWVGVPYKKSLAFDSGLAGKAIVGVGFRAPLCGRFFIEGYGSYMVPHSSGRVKQQNYAANLCLELKYLFGGTPRCDAPLMPIGNNSNFIGDTNFVPGA
jgi:hypothetical protein